MNSPTVAYIHRLLHRFQPKSWRKKRQDFSAFALTYILRLSSCRVMGDFVISPLPRLLTKELCAAGPLCSTGVAPFQRYYGPSRHRLGLRPFSRDLRAEVKNRRCLNPACPSYGTVGSRSIIHNGFYRTRSGKRRRYRCGECGKTFSSTKGMPYYRLQHRRATFDEVIALRVEGVSISSISRIEGIAWNTVARWLEKAAQVCRRFNHRRIAAFAAEELQADEIHTFAGNKKTPSWVFVTIEVWSRLWPSTVTGRRSYRNTHHSVSRPFEADEFRTSSPDRHGWIRILPEGHPSLLRDQHVFTARSSRRAGTVVSSRSNGERCTEPRGDSKTRSITPRTPRH